MARARRALDADVDYLAASLGKLPEPVVRPALIVLIGLPGTGKSYLSARLAERLDVVVLESDALRKQLYPSPSYSWRESGYLFRVINTLIERLLNKSMPVILDATNLAESSREPLYSIAERSGARLILMETNAPPELVHARLESRQAGDAGHSDAGWTVYERMVATVEKIRRRHYVVDTSKDIGPIVDRIVREATS